MNKTILASFVLGLLAGGFAVHLYDGSKGSRGQAPVRTAVSADGCGDVATIKQDLATLMAQAKKVPPTVEDKREDGTPYTRPNRLYEQMMLQMIETKTKLEAAQACQQGSISAG